MMTLDEVAEVMNVVVKEINILREAGQKEYAGGSNAFGNFERLAARLDLDRKQILWVYVTKHLDGIESYIKGHKSQREDIRGRINDVMVYLVLLRAMIDDSDNTKEKANAILIQQQRAMQNMPTGIR